MSDWIGAHLETERLEEDRRHEVRRYAAEICEAMLEEIQEALAVYAEGHPDSRPDAAAEPAGEGWAIRITRPEQKPLCITYLPEQARLEVERGGKVDVEIAVDRRRAPLAQAVHRMVYFRFDDRDWGLEDFIRFVLEPYLFSHEIIEKTALRHPTLIDAYKHAYEDVLRGRR